MKRSLKQKKILVTREATQAKVFSDLIKWYDGIPIEVPLLRINCRMLERNMNVDDYQWIFFTSAHGVHCFFKNNPPKINVNIKFATVGHKTELALNQYGYQATFIPTTYNAEVMAEEFFNYFPNANQILLIRGNLSREVLVKELNERKITFHKVVVYDTEDNKAIKATLFNVLLNDKLDMLTFTSPSTVRAFMRIIQGYSGMEDILNIPCFCIGTTTEKEVKSYRFKRTIVPEKFTIEDMVEEMVKYVEREERK